MSSRELENGGDEGCRAVCAVPEDGISVEVRSAKKEKTFEYDQVFACDSTQEKVYAEIADLVVSVLDGYNVCIFAYGQTGLGSASLFSCLSSALVSRRRRSLASEANGTHTHAIAATPSLRVPLDAAMRRLAVRPRRHPRRTAIDATRRRRLGQDLHHERPAGEPRLQPAGYDLFVKSERRTDAIEDVIRVGIRDLQEICWWTRLLKGPVEGPEEARGPTGRAVLRCLHAVNASTP